MTEKQIKIDYLMEGYKRTLGYEDQLSFLLAICFLKKNDYIEAHRIFNISFKKMFIPPMFWKDSGQVNWLIDICILSGGKQYFPDVLQEVNLYKNIPSRGNSIIAYYAYALMEFLMPTGWDISTSISELLKRPKLKLWYAIGQVIQSIVNDSPYNFNNTLSELLKAHERVAKMGSLRETAEGLICMQGMSLAYVARKRGIEVTVENEYLPLDYLDLLMGINAWHE